MPNRSVSLTALEKGIELATGQHHKLILRKVPVEIYLHDALRSPIPNAPYLLICEGQTVRGNADGDGKVQAKVLEGAKTCTLRWRRAPAKDPDGDEFEFERTIYLDLASSGEAEGRQRRLHNLGLPAGAEPDLAFHLFKQVWTDDGDECADDDADTKLDDVAKAPISLDEGDASEGEDDESERT